MIGQKIMDSAYEEAEARLERAYGSECTNKTKVTTEMIDRFLTWKLPDDFSPDCGIEFNREKAIYLHFWPTGTNLFTAEQARQMLEHVLVGP